MTEMPLLHHQENADIVAQIVNRWRRTKFLSDKDQRRLTCALQNMRMACNSTYLLDQETDHGVKADELAALLDGVFVQPDAKAVVFSQWTRTHDIVIRQARGSRHRLRQLPWRRAFGKASGAGRTLSRRPALPRLPVHRRRRGRA